MLLSFEEMRNVCLWPNWNGDHEEPLTADQIHTAEEIWNQFPKADVEVSNCGNIFLLIPLSNKQSMCVTIGDQTHGMAVYVAGLFELEKDNIGNKKVQKTITNIHYFVEFYKWYNQGR